MKKIVNLLLLFVMPLLFVACDNEWDLDWEVNKQGKVCHDEIVLTGELYELNSTWYLRTDMRSVKGFFWGDEDGWEIQIGEYPQNISLADIEGRENTFRGKLTLQDTWSDGMMVVMYYYTFDIYDIK